MTPDYILHAGYLGSLGMDATSGGGQDFPIYPESKVRTRLWERWLPDIFLNPHGYPSHQVVQLFSEYTGLVRRGRVTERNWGFNKGWFMPGFGYIDDPDFPRHKDAAFKIRDYITAGINSNEDVFEMNQRNYDRYRRYGAAFDPEVFRLPLTDSVLIEMPLKGGRGGGGGRGFNPAGDDLERHDRSARRDGVRAMDGTGGEGGAVVGPGDSGLPLRWGARGEAERIGFSWGGDAEDESGEAARGEEGDAR